MSKLVCTPCGKSGEHTTCPRCGSYLCDSCKLEHSDARCIELKEALRDYEA